MLAYDSQSIWRYVCVADTEKMKCGTLNANRDKWLQWWLCSIRYFHCKLWGWDTLVVVTGQPLPNGAVRINPQFTKGHIFQSHDSYCDALSNSPKPLVRTTISLFEDKVCTKVANVGWHRWQIYLSLRDMSTNCFPMEPKTISSSLRRERKSIEHPVAYQRATLTLSKWVLLSLSLISLLLQYWSRMVLLESVVGNVWENRILCFMYASKLACSNMYDIACCIGIDLYRSVGSEYTNGKELFLKASESKQ